MFDVAEHLLLVDVNGTSQSGRRIRRLRATESLPRAQALAANDVDVLICGAISRPMEHALAGAGVEVVSGICGNVECVLRAFSLGLLDDDPTLHLPGRRPSQARRAVRVCSSAGRSGETR